MNEGTVRLLGLEFHARHGVFAAEAELGARFVADVEYSYPFPEHDDLTGAVNYAEVYAAVCEEMARPRALIEVLAQEIAARLLREHPRVRAVTVRIHKPAAPLPGVFRDVQAEVRLARPAGGAA